MRLLEESVSGHHKGWPLEGTSPQRQRETETESVQRVSPVLSLKLKMLRKAGLGISSAL